MTDRGTLELNGRACGPVFKVEAGAGAGAGAGALALKAFSTKSTDNLNACNSL